MFYLVVPTELTHNTFSTLDWIARPTTHSLTFAMCWCVPHLVFHCETQSECFSKGRSQRPVTWIGDQQAQSNQDHVVTPTNLFTFICRLILDL